MSHKDEAVLTGRDISAARSKRMASEPMKTYSILNRTGSIVESQLHLKFQLPQF